LADIGLLEPISADLHRGAAEPLWRSLAALDAYRRRFDRTPDVLTNPVLLGSLIVPLGIPLGSDRGRTRVGPEPKLDQAEVEGESESTRAPGRGGRRLGALPLARRDLERLRQVLGFQRRVHDLGAIPRQMRYLAYLSIL